MRNLARMKRTLCVVLLGASLAHSARGQSSPAADSLLRRGSLERAESLYYAAVRARPRDPHARWALGRFLAGRGAPRVAVTLLEEAERFGGPRGPIAADLAPLYLYVGDYRALATLAPSPLSAAERERARWLESNPTRVIAPDSVLIVSYSDTTAVAFPGHIPIRVNGRIVDAAISVSVSGLVVSDSVATAVHIRRFIPKPLERGASDLTPAAADSIGIGRLVITHYPLRVDDTTRTPATIGLDALGKFAPTFDAALGRIVLRVDGKVPAGWRGDRFATWTTPSNVRLLQAGGWISITDPRIIKLLRGRAWTFDAKRGQILIP